MCDVNSQGTVPTTLATHVEFDTNTSKFPVWTTLIFPNVIAEHLTLFP